MHTVEKIFEAKIVRRGGLVRRSRKFLEEHGLLEKLLNAAAVRGYSVIEYGGQVIVFCGGHQLKVLR